MPAATINQHRYFTGLLIGMGYNPAKIRIIKLNVVKKIRSQIPENQRYNLWSFSDLDKDQMFKAIELIKDVKGNKLLSNVEID